MMNRIEEKQHAAIQDRSDDWKLRKKSLTQRTAKAMVSRRTGDSCVLREPAAADRPHWGLGHC
jgi:hypothetical protein